MCCHLFFILFCCAAEITHVPICETYPPTGDSEVHQPAAGRDLHKAACGRGTFCVVDDWDFEGSIHLFLLSGWKMNCQLLYTYSDMTLHVAEACFMLGPQLWTSGSEKGVCWRGGEQRRASILDPLTIFCACASCGKEVSASHLCFPSRALEQDEAIKAQCRCILTVSLLCKLHAQMLLFSASGFPGTHS